MNLDIKKLTATPEDKFEAVRMMNEARQNLLDALHILESFIEFDSEPFKSIHKKRALNFIKKFEKS